MKIYSLAIASGLLLATASLLPAQDPGKHSEEQKDRHARILARFDTNHNGVLDPDEKAAMEKFKAERLAKYDKNGDGKLDQSEREAMKADRRAHRKNKPATPATPAISSTDSTLKQ